MLSLILFAISSVIFFYLSLRSYSIKSDDSIANLCPTGSEIWNCDAALTSPFSEIWGIPISQFGVASSLFCMMILIFLRFNFLERKISWSRWVWRIALASAFTSTIMFFISWFFLKSFCLLCTICYILSFAVLFPLRKTLVSSQLIDSKVLFSWRKWRHPLDVMVRAILIILFIVFLLHAWSTNLYSIKNKSSQATSNFQDWKRKKITQIKKNIPRVSYGPQEASMVITEFADFLCPHCKRVYSVIKTFQQAFPNTRIEYINFPLDPRGCRTNDDSTIISASCYLSKAVLCAHQQDMSSQLKDLIFSQQKFFIKNRSQIKNIQEKIFEYMNHTTADKNLFQQCIDYSVTQEKVAQQIREGQRLGIKGTPTLFVNQKRLQPISVHMTLEKIYRYLSSD